MPLCNVPLIEYTLEALSAAAMEDIFIICCAHSEIIKNYIAFVQSLGKELF